MATAETEPEGAAQELHEKDVVITAYVAGEFEDERELIDEILGDQVDKDLYETEETEDRNVELQIDIEGEYEGTTKNVTFSYDPFFTSEKEALKNALSKEELPDWVKLVDETVVTTDHVHKPSDLIKTVVQKSIGNVDLSDLDYGDKRTGTWAASWSREVDNRSVDADPDETIDQYIRVTTCRSAEIQKRKVLRHQDERTQLNKYMDDQDEMWSFQTTVHIEASSSEEMDAISERLTVPVYKALSQIDGVEFVRLSECDQQVTMQGSCYNL